MQVAVVLTLVMVFVSTAHVIPNDVNRDSRTPLYKSDVIVEKRDANADDTAFPIAYSQNKTGDDRKSPAGFSRDNIGDDTELPAISSSMNNTEDRASSPVVSKDNTGDKASYSKDLTGDSVRRPGYRLMALYSPPHNATPGHQSPPPRHPAVASAPTKVLDEVTTGDDGRNMNRAIIIPLVSFVVFIGFAVITWISLLYSCRLHRRNVRDGVYVTFHHLEFTEDSFVGPRL